MKERLDDADIGKMSSVAAKMWRQLGEQRKVSIMFHYKLSYDTCMLYLQDFLEMFPLTKMRILGTKCIARTFFNEDRN